MNWSSLTRFISQPVLSPARLPLEGKLLPLRTFTTTTSSWRTSLESWHLPCRTDGRFRKRRADQRRRVTDVRRPNKSGTSSRAIHTDFSGESRCFSFSLFPSFSFTQIWFICWRVYCPGRDPIKGACGSYTALFSPACYLYRLRAAGANPSH